MPHRTASPESQNLHRNIIRSRATGEKLWEEPLVKKKNTDVFLIKMCELDEGGLKRPSLFY